jgi:hypothetical protein
MTINLFLGGVGSTYMHGVLKNIYTVEGEKLKTDDNYHQHHPPYPYYFTTPHALDYTFGLVYYGGDVLDSVRSLVRRDYGLIQSYYLDGDYNWIKKLNYTGPPHTSLFSDRPKEQKKLDYGSVVITNNI